MFFVSVLRYEERKRIVSSCIIDNNCFTSWSFRAIPFLAIGRNFLWRFSLTLTLKGRHLQLIYRKIPMISPGLIFVQKAFLVGLFSGELVFGGAYYWKEFCVSKWVGLDNRNN